MRKRERNPVAKLLMGNVDAPGPLRSIVKLIARTSRYKKNKVRVGIMWTVALGYVLLQLGFGTLIGPTAWRSWHDSSSSFIEGDTFMGFDFLYVAVAATLFVAALVFSGRVGGALFDFLERPAESRWLIYKNRLRICLACSLASLFLLHLNGFVAAASSERIRAMDVGGKAISIVDHIPPVEARRVLDDESAGRWYSTGADDDTTRAIKQTLKQGMSSQRERLREMLQFRAEESAVTNRRLRSQSATIETAR